MWDTDEHYRRFWVACAVEGDHDLTDKLQEVTVDWGGAIFPALYWAKN